MEITIKGNPKEKLPPLYWRCKSGKKSISLGFGHLMSANHGL